MCATTEETIKAATILAHYYKTTLTPSLHSLQTLTPATNPAQLIRVIASSHSSLQNAWKEIDALDGTSEAYKDLKWEFERKCRAVLRTAKEEVEGTLGRGLMRSFGKWLANSFLDSRSGGSDVEERDSVSVDENDDQDGDENIKELRSGVVEVCGMVIELGFSNEMGLAICDVVWRVVEAVIEIMMIDDEERSDR